MTAPAPRPQKIRRLTPSEREEVLRRYGQGESSEALADAFGVSGPAIRATVRRLGGSIRSATTAHRVLPLNEGAFDLLSPDAAYWAGVLITDGCVYDAENPESSPRVELTWHADDLEHLRAFDRFMGGTGDSRINPARSYFRWDARSSRLASALAVLGIVPRKTKSAAPCAALADDPHFWRGCWDGDGEVDEGNGCPALSLVGSFRLVEAFCAFFARICPEYPLKPRHSGHTDCTAYIHLYGHGAMVLLRALYGAEGPAMPRKAAKARELLTKYADRDFRILKANIHQRTTFPYTYTDLRKAHESFRELQALDGAALVTPLLKGGGSGRHLLASVAPVRTGAYASHYFHEAVRMQAGVRGHVSPADAWADASTRERIIEEAENRKHSSLRASLTANTRPCWGFRPATAKAVYQYLAPRDRPVRILDPCAGWGDRLTAALALPNLGSYLGFDPNTTMAPVYERIRNCFAPDAPAFVGTMAFEDATGPAGFDIAFTSPPYFDYERYSADADQSYLRYPTVEAWIEGFLRPLVRRSAEALVPGGMLAINLADAGGGALVDALHEAGDDRPDLQFAGTLLMPTGNFDRASEGIFCWRKR